MKKAPRTSQEGSHEFDVVLPAEKTKSGKPETVRIGFRWKVSATRPPTARDHVQQAAYEARDALKVLANTLDHGQELSARQTDDLAKALTCAVKAWCWASLRDVDKTVNNHTYHRAFDQKAPDDLWEAECKARTAIHEHIEFGSISASEALSAVEAAVNAVLAAPTQPPRNKPRFPASLRNIPLRQSPRKPRVQPGSWIDTGRYRPAEVLTMMPDPPHIMKLSYGDEIDEDFRPHITNWKSVRRRKRIPSLKDLYSPGDWIRHPRHGYGQLLAVRNSTMDVDFRGRTAKMAPEADLGQWMKVDDPGPADLRPVRERLPPGTWIETVMFGEGVVLAIENRAGIEDDTLKVLFNDGISLIREPGIGEEGPVIWKLNRAELDPNSSWGQRWSWWWQHWDIFREPVCACCGYPNFGQGERNRFLPRECPICGYPDFGAGLEDDDAPLVLRLHGFWYHRDAWGFPEPDESATVSSESSEPDWKGSGYSMKEARNNFETRGSMFRPDESGSTPAQVLTDLRRSLILLLEKRRIEPSEWREEDGKSVERIRQEILTKFT